MGPVALRPDYPLRSERLVLRPVCQADAADLLSYRSIPEVTRWVPFDPMDAETMSSYIDRVSSYTTLETEGDALILGVAVASSGQLVGDVMLRWGSEEHRCVEVGYVFHPSVAGQGYATEAVHVLLKLAFDGLGAHRAIARIDARNERSARLARRVGMRLEAHLVENEWFKGGWSDELDYAILDREWRERDGAAGS
jgi:RimJ/RimL family protein N-acetyltransferase